MSKAPRSKPAKASRAPANPAAAATRTNAAQSSETRATLVAVARKLFGERGYADVSTEEIVRAASVTRGALYHQFSDKRDLFRTVYEEIEAELVAQIFDAMTGETDPWQVMKRGSLMFLDQCLNPAVVRIAIFDAPSVLGFEAHREVVDKYGGALVEGTLTALMEQGTIVKQPVRPLANVLRGALIEGGITIAEASDKDIARGEVGAVIEGMLDGLLA